MIDTDLLSVGAVVQGLLAVEGRDGVSRRGPAERRKAPRCFKWVLADTGIRFTAENAENAETAESDLRRSDTPCRGPLFSLLGSSAVHTGERPAQWLPLSCTRQKRSARKAAHCRAKRPFATLAAPARSGFASLGARQNQHLICAANLTLALLPHSRSKFAALGEAFPAQWPSTRPT